MTVFTVPDDYSLGEAIWLSSHGDTIAIKSGDYGRIIVKGCNINFPKDYSATATQIVGAGGNCRIANWKKKNNIKSIFIFRKILNVKLRLEKDERYFHPTGTEIIVAGHDIDSITFGGSEAPTAEEKLPKSIVDVIVPWLEEIDFEILEIDFDPSNPILFQKRIAEEQKINNLLRGHGSKHRFGDVEYIALWSLNHFIRQYSKIAGLRDQKGFSLSEFRDGIFIGFGRPNDSNIKLHSQQYIDQYKSALLDDKQKQELFDFCLSSPDHSIAEYIQDNLKHLNYSTAVVGMAQFLESRTGAGRAKWDAIKNCSLSIDAKQYLAEIIIARDVILHQKECAVKQNADAFKQAQKDFGIFALSEYRIYESKRPWDWYYEGLIPFLKELES
ncbi:MAG: hypothetical protein JRF25_14290 [Deltaproteobacteria bacterium]|nr:hypothetical protein [Deltaproteobacteria bacterium]